MFAYSEGCKHVQLPLTSGETAAPPSSEAREKQVQISAHQSKEHIKTFRGVTILSFLREPP